MQFKDFRKSSGLDAKGELERAKLLAFYKAATAGVVGFSAATMGTWMTDAGFAAPNHSRLGRSMRSSRDFARLGKNEYRLTAGALGDLSTEFPDAGKTESVVVDSDKILPSQLYEESRGYIQSLGRQINKSYSENLFDATAVLMRRLLEILLILAFRHHGEEAAIERDGKHLQLDQIMSIAKTSPKLKLSRNTRASLDDFRTLGNFAAHKIEYTTRRGDIDGIRVEYRGTVEELLYKSGVKE
jgi:hypothetical protein